MVKMALICNVELESGLSLNGSYLKITNFSGTEKELSFQLNVYADKTSFEEKRPPVAYLSFVMEYNKGRDIFEQMYDYLKSLPEYTGAINA